MSTGSTRTPPQGMNKLDPRLVTISGMTRSTLLEALEGAAARHNVVPFSRRGLPARPLEPDASAEQELEPRWPAPAPLLHGLRLDGERILASVLITFRGSPERLAELGARPRSMAAGVATAEIPLDGIPQLAADPDVVFIYLSQRAAPLLDRSARELGAGALHGARPPIAGAGIVVGIIDVEGIDFHHPDFTTADASGPRSRIAHLWDQCAEPSPAAAGITPEPWGYGVEYTGADLDADLRSGAPRSVVPHCPEVDPRRVSHGTHITGIAAGNGRGAGGGPACVGIAPEADIIFVNTRADEVAICDALAFIFARAGARPCVVNISMGGDLGPHDGTGPLERFVDGIAGGRGRAVVVAAGNSNGRGVHLEAAAPDGGAACLELVVPPETRDGETIEIWYSAGEHLELAVRAPGAAVAAGPIRPGDIAAALRIGGATIHASSIIGDGRNGDNVIQLLIEPSHPWECFASGVWRLELARAPGQGSPPRRGKLCAWTAGNTRMRWDRATRDRCTLSNLASARGVIAVGNYLPEEGGTASSTSGRGPTRDGRAKPDLAAPGAAIMAPLASADAAHRPALYASGFGTSQAAAHVSGLAALVFQCRGADLDAAAVKAILRAAADRTGLPRRPDPALGWGRARAHAVPTAPILMDAPAAPPADNAFGAPHA